MIAYCGLICDTCPLFLATIEQDGSRQLKMREEIARKCTEYYKMEIRPQDVSDCDGCTAGTGRLFSGCSKCEIRKCAVQRNLASCACCIDFACETLEKHFALDPGARQRLEELRKTS